MRIGMVAGESSGDLLGAALISEIKKHYPEAVFEGIAGPRMIKEGCNALFPSDKLSIMGLAEAIGHYHELKSIREQLFNHFQKNPPDVFIGVDAPDFNLGLEYRLKSIGIKTVQYASPQVWAWRQYRVKKISKSVDLLLSLFPFEKDFYREHNVNVEYVGHPLADKIPLIPDMHAARSRLDLPRDRKILAILPGSRISEAKNLSDIFVQAADWCHKKYPELSFVVPFTRPLIREIFERSIEKYGKDLPFYLIDGRSRDVIEAADAVLLASGTATLEAMLYKRPMVMAYKVSWITYYIWRMLVRIKLYSLPNLLAGHAVIPELIQSEVTPENIGRNILQSIENTDNVESLVSVFTEIHNQLRQDTSKKAAGYILSLIDISAES